MGGQVTREVKERMDRMRRRRLLPTVEAQLVDWIDEVTLTGEPRAETLARAGFKVYLRHTPRVFPGCEPTLDSLVLANVEIPQRFRGRGWFSIFLRVAESLCPWDALVLESVMNQRLADHIRRLGTWVEIEDMTGQLPLFVLPVRPIAGMPEPGSLVPYAGFRFGSARQRHPA